MKLGMLENLNGKIINLNKNSIGIEISKSRSQIIIIKNFQKNKFIQFKLSKYLIKNIKLKINLF